MTHHFYTILQKEHKTSNSMQKTLWKQMSEVWRVCYSSFQKESKDLHCIDLANASTVHNHFTQRPLLYTCNTVKSISNIVSGVEVSGVSNMCYCALITLDQCSDHVMRCRILFTITFYDVLLNLKKRDSQNNRKNNELLNRVYHQLDQVVTEKNRS